MTEGKITVGGKERLFDAADTLRKCFENDPIITFTMNSKTREQRLKYLPRYFEVLIKAAVLNDAVITEIDDYAACAVWMPPGKEVDNWATNFQAGFIGALWNIGSRGIWQMMVDFTMTVDAVKKAEIAKHKKCYYLFFVGTLPEFQGKGRGTTLVRHWQKKAAAEGASIWLEATTPDSHRLYLRLGFRDVKKLLIGKGKAATDGSYMAGGEGVPLWTMIWTSEENQPDNTVSS